uniref:Putative reverse transcriptase domain-containing protein n=1 Tax=Tanacetum cinerariifolium TaxID=118510 RepID=A0A699H1E6_TANCI|nr:putative reverse transcriptase domain-containing protein [Tanacetum cinerariifolium]
MTPEVVQAMIDQAMVMEAIVLEEDPQDPYNLGEIKKLEIELCNLKVKGNDVVSYTQRFQELALMCTKFVANEEKVDKYIDGLPDNIYGNVMSARPTTLDEAIKLANDLMDQKLCTYSKRQSESKRKFDNNNQAQQLPKRQNVAQAYAVGTGEKKEYAGTLPLCNKCKFYHNGPYTTKIERPQQLSRVHNTFHVSNLKNLSDESLLIPLDELHVDDELHFVEEPLEIMDREIKQLKRSHIPIIKVGWNSKRGPEFTWGREDQFKKKYPHLFTNTVSSSSN